MEELPVVVALLIAGVSLIGWWLLWGFSDD
jgi:hypothetical protein